MPRLYMETTKVAANRTAGEVSELLSAARARSIMQEFDVGGRITSLSFAIEVGGREFAFRLPVRYEPVFAFLQKRRPTKTRS